MKELDLLKKDWKKNESSFNQLSETEIYKMIHQKSSSIVRWIFIISIIEVLLWIGIGVISNTGDYIKEMKYPENNWYLQFLDVFHYVVIIVFIYLFYKNYTTISTTASTKLLMRSILKTRKIVQCYVWYNLAMLVVTAISAICIAVLYTPEISNLTDQFATSPQLAIITFGILFLMVLGLLAILWTIYRLIYGRLLRRLYANYNELKKIDL
ncbi:hypothetical protein ACRASX_00200 [Flavobacterium sp. TMP13]|uniref:hypothetical protein n=1 Tax=Flavobacterium sp. TMP13 TaxID=3425950 RepID=UPI003D789A79